MGRVPRSRMAVRAYEISTRAYPGVKRVKIEMRQLIQLAGRSLREQARWLTAMEAR
ncbi:hypothetical protein KCP75_01540 [Salmonella enterica subsp. enterica]|nr:hypothetical protein KCP75_01540 [Salmonella enterica subsp. enterica]